MIGPPHPARARLLTGANSSRSTTPGRREEEIRALRRKRCSGLTVPSSAPRGPLGGARCPPDDGSSREHRARVYVITEARRT